MIRKIHNSFVKIAEMTPLEYRNKGENLAINYDFLGSKFGNILVASTKKGICHISFANNESEGLDVVKKYFSNAKFQKKSDIISQNLLDVFSCNYDNLHEIKLHLKGTEFQIKVWKNLLKIPVGKLLTYGEVAKEIGNSKAARAVGSAVGDNVIAFLIPCHRIIQASGKFGQYRWGSDRKAAMIKFEKALL